MLVIKILLATATFPLLNAIIVDSYYTPSQTKEQIQGFQPSKSQSRPQPNPNEESYHSKEATEQYSKPLYKYGYSVLDPYTLDVKSHWEHRDGDFVKGAYNMLEADGSMRIVEYVADKDTGFRAIVKKIPHYLKNERIAESFPSKPNNFPDQYFAPPPPPPPPQKSLIQAPIVVRPAPPSVPAPYQNIRHEKPHLQYQQNARPYDDRPFNENIIPRDNYHEKPYQKHILRKHPPQGPKYRHIIHTQPRRR